MTVQELIDALSELPRDLKVIIGSDEEGNDFVDPFFPDESWAVEDDTRCGLRPIHPDDVAEYDEDDLVKVVAM